MAHCPLAAWYDTCAFSPFAFCSLLAEMQAPLASGPRTLSQKASPKASRSKNFGRPRLTTSREPREIDTCI